MKKYVTLKIILVLLFFIPKTTYAQGPVLTATGDQTYCDAPLNIAQTVSITDSSATTTDASVYIQIPTGYVFGEDILTLTGTHPNISSTWNETEGKLTLSPIPVGGTVSYAELEAAILGVEYNSSSMTPAAGEKTFSILLGVGNRELSYLPRNGHYYEYVPLLGVTWTTARFLAETYVYHGLQGYLVTLTAADEQQLAGIQAPGAGWIGATDEAVEGDWRWVTGPEGLANGGTGTPFWDGIGCLGCGGFNVPTLDGEFSFWNSNYGEPNSAGPGEDYAHIVDPDLPGSRDGSWNDMPINGGPIGGYYEPKGFVVEYGGMPGDNPDVQILATTTLTIPDGIYYPTRSATICASETATFLGIPTTIIPGAPTTTQVYWYDDPTSVTPIATGTSFTTPSLNNTTTFYSDNGCFSQRKSFTVTVNPSTLPTFDAIPNICENDTAPVLPSTSTNSITGTWSPASVSNTATGTYTFTPDAGQCAAPTSLTVTVNPSTLPTFDAIPAICTNATAPVLPSTSTNGFTGTWNPATVSNTATGTYTFTPDVGQCASTASITVTVGSNILPTFDAIPDICENDTAPVLPTMSTNGFSGTWSPATVSNTATGTYTFTPDAGQCATTASITVTVNPNILPTFDAIPDICENDTAPVLPTMSTNGFTGTWSPANVSNTATGTYTFTPDAGQCATTASLTVTVNQKSLPTFNVIPAICANATAPVLPSASANGFTGTWSPANVSNTATGTYTFTPDAGQCATTASLTVTVNPNILPTFDAIPAICANATAPVLPSASTNGFTGTWSPATISNTTTGTYTFTPDAGQCATTASITVTVNPNILPTFDAIPDICENDTAPVLPTMSTNGFSGTWSPATVSNTETGTYTFTPDAGQCTTTASLTVTVNPLPNIDLNLDGSADEVVCSDDITSFSFTLDAGILDNTPTSDYSYIWSKDGSVLPDTTPTLDVSEIGVYTIEVTSTFGCSQIRTITVKTSKSPTIDTIEIVDLTTNNSVTVNLEEPGDFQYTMDDPNGIWQDSNVFSNVSGGEHTVYVSDKYGCPGDSRVIVVVSAPKFFTPNNDSYNDYWNVKGLSDDDSKSIIYIFDRYGKLLKQWIPSLDPLGWDGTFNGSPLPSDDYWYTLKLENGREAKGHFSLKR